MPLRPQQPLLSSFIAAMRGCSIEESEKVFGHAAHDHVDKHLNRFLALALLHQVGSAETDTVKAATEPRGAIAKVVATHEPVRLNPAVR